MALTYSDICKIPSKKVTCDNCLRYFRYNQLKRLFDGRMVCETCYPKCQNDGNGFLWTMQNK